MSYIASRPRAKGKHVGVKIEKFRCVQNIGASPDFLHCKHGEAKIEIYMFRVLYYLTNKRKAQIGKGREAKGEFKIYVCRF